VYQGTLQILLALMLASQVSIGMAASPAIGVALANGSFRIDDAQVWGNGTLFEGTTVETGKSYSQLQLQGGIRMQLASNSRGTVYKDRLVLEKGTGQLENASDFRIEAGVLRIISDGRNVAARVELKGDDRIQVAALQGNLRVATASGLTLAALEAGKALEFEPQGAGASAPSTLTGCLAKHGDYYVLTDETAGVTVELKGPGLDKEAGHRVTVTGATAPSATPEAGASQVVQVSSLKQISGGCPSLAAGAGETAGPSSAPAGAAGGAGMAAGTKAVIAGVIIAAAATGAAIGLTAGEEQQTISR
jgi:hypothetical protein